MISCNLNRPMNWKNFKQLSKESKEEYIGNLQREYSATATAIASMLGTTALTMRRHIAEEGLDIKFNMSNRMKDRQRARWEMFLAGEMPSEKETNTQEDDSEKPEADTVATNPPVISEDTVTVSEPSDKKTDEPTEIQPQKDEKAAMEMSCLVMTFAGNIEVNAVANSLRNILGDASYGNLYIKFDNCAGKSAATLF